MTHCMKEPPDTIIDMHCHPFMDPTYFQNSWYDKNIQADDCIREQKLAGITRFSGSVYRPDYDITDFDASIRKMNDEAYAFWEHYGDIYIPGIHVHPNFIKESCDEIERAHKRGVKIVGELVPYSMGWRDYATREFMEIMECAAAHNMLVSIHTSESSDKDLQALAENVKNVKFILAHPNETPTWKSRLELLKKHDNLYVDLSGTGLLRYGMLRYGIDQVGKERILFGTDYPICNPAMYVAGVMMEKLTDDEREHIFSKNALTLLGE